MTREKYTDYIGGDRAHCNGWNPATKEVLDFNVCIDCEYFAEYGQLDDMTMMEVSHV